MKKIKLFGTVLLITMTLAGCGNLDKGVSKVDQQTVSDDKTVSTGRINSGEYQALMRDGKYQTPTTDDVNASRANSDYTPENFENGLLRLSKQNFSVDKYFFEEGQKISTADAEKWLGRLTDENPEGLNPTGEDQPIIFQQILEQDFYEEDGQTLGGISIGLGFNSIYYHDGGETPISREDVVNHARKTVNSVLTRVRKMDGLANVPIVFGIYEQSSRDDLGGGNYIYSVVSKNGETTVDQLQPITEAHIMLPAEAGADNEATKDGLNNKFNDLKNTIQSFFPDTSGITGVAYYSDDKLNNLTITATTKYTSRTELISFAQYIGKQVETVFSDVDGEIEVKINSIDGPQGFVKKETGQAPQVFIFN